MGGVTRASQSSPLAELQASFQRYLLGQDGLFLEAITRPCRGCAAERAEIYADGYRSRLVEALQNDFPALHAMLDDDAFSTMGAAYLARHPSHHPSIRWFGQRLAQFLSVAVPYRDRPALAELAAFEWALSLSFDAEDEPPLTVETLAGVAVSTWPALRLRFHPSVRRLNLRWNVVDFWQTAQGERPPQVLEQSEWPTSWLIWRQQLRSKFRALTVDEAAAIDAALAGASFAEICQTLTEWTDEVNTPLRAASLIKQWVVNALLIGVETCD